MSSNVNLYLRQIEVGPMENFIYLIGDKNKKECVMVDPAWEVDRILKIAAGDDMKVIAGLATHHHSDHTNGIGDLVGAAGCPIYVHKSDIPYLKNVKNEIKPSDAGDEIQVGDITIT